MNSICFKSVHYRMPKAKDNVNLCNGFEVELKEKLKFTVIPHFLQKDLPHP